MSDKRKEFENTDWITNTVDLLPENPLADKDCVTCKGYGVVDLGYDLGTILDNCPSCHIKKEKPG